MRPREKKPKKKRAVMLASRPLTTLAVNDADLAVSIAEQAYELDSETHLVNCRCGNIMRTPTANTKAIVHLSNTLKSISDHDGALIKLGNVYHSINPR